MVSEAQPPRARIRRWKRWIVEGALVLAVFAGMQIWLSRGAVSGMAPPLHGVSAQGDALSAPIGQGEPTVVHFWATWCGICGAMDDNVDMLSRHFEVTSVALKSGSGAEVLAHMQQRDLSFPVIMDAGEHAARWGVNGVPTTFFIGADGQIQRVSVGYSTRAGLFIRAWLASL